MWQIFIHDFLLKKDSEAEVDLGPRGSAHMVKKDLTEETYGVYASFDSEAGAEEREYTLIAVAECGKRCQSIRFFDGEIFRRLFSEEDRKALRDFSGREFLEFDQVVEDMMSSLAGKWVGEQLLPLPGSVDGQDEAFYRQDVSRYLFIPEMEKCSDKLLESVLSWLDAVFCQNDSLWTCYRGCGWYREMALRWLASTISPNYPHFDIQSEKAAYLATIDRMTREILADPDDDITKSVAMRKAVDGQDVVSVEFICNDESKERLNVYADVFRKCSFFPENDDDIIVLEYGCPDGAAALDPISHKLPSALYEKDSDSRYRWLNKGDIFTIRGQNGEPLWECQTPPHTKRY